MTLWVTAHHLSQSKKTILPSLVARAIVVVEI